MNFDEFGINHENTSKLHSKSCDYLLIIHMKKVEMVKQKMRTRITQSRKSCSINCAIQG